MVTLKNSLSNHLYVQMVTLKNIFMNYASDEYMKVMIISKIFFCFVLFDCFIFQSCCIMFLISAKNRGFKML